MTDEALLRFEYEYVGGPEDTPLIQNGMRLLTARAALVQGPPESPSLFGRLVTTVLAGEIDPLGPVPPRVLAQWPLTVAFLRETFRIPVRYIGDEMRWISLAGAYDVQGVGQCSSIDEYRSRYLRVCRSAAPPGSEHPGPWTDWACGMCPRTWPDGEEPRECPDCGYLLLRVSLLP